MSDDLGSSEALRLSVVVMVDSQRARAERALESLLSQEMAERMEVIVLDFGHSENPPLRGSAHPGVRTIASARGPSYGETLATGVRAARAPVVAFVEEHVAVRLGWAEALVRAHEGPWAAVCGELHPGDANRGTARRIELVSRNRWSPPARRGESDVLRWQNTSYKREVLLGCGSELSLLLDTEGTLFKRLRWDGHALYIEPDAKADHAHEETWSEFLRGSFHSNRLSVASAVEASRPGPMGLAITLAKVLIGPVRWPLVLLARTRTLPRRDTWLPFAFRSAAYVFEYYAVVAAASLLGVLLGRGDSGRRFIDFELNADRHPFDSEQERRPTSN